MRLLTLSIPCLELKVQQAYNWFYESAITNYNSEKKLGFSYLKVKSSKSDFCLEVKLHKGVGTIDIKQMIYWIFCFHDFNGLL
jgi:hypothetical protein